MIEACVKAGVTLILAALAYAERSDLFRLIGDASVKLGELNNERKPKRDRIGDEVHLGYCVN